MKKTIALVLTLVMAATLFVMPAFAHYDFDNIPHNTPLKHQYLMIKYMDDGVDIVRCPREEQMTMEDMDELVANLEHPEELIPEDCKVIPGRIGFLESRKVLAVEEGVEQPYHVFFRVWGTSHRPVLIFFRAEDSDTWELILCHKGDDMHIEFPGDGYYAVGAAW